MAETIRRWVGTVGALIVGFAIVGELNNYVDAKREADAIGMIRGTELTTCITLTFLSDAEPTDATCVNVLKAIDAYKHRR